MFIIGISGGSGSGKTSFINDVRSQFEDSEITLLSQDEYYQPREQQSVDENGVKNYDLPTSIDLVAFREDIQKIKDGNIVYRKEYTFNNKLKKPKIIEYQPSKVMLVEGLFIFHDPEIRKLLDLAIIIHANDAVKVIRRIHRDQIERNYPLEDVLYRYENHVLPAYQLYIEPYLGSVDLIVNNNKDYKAALKMVVGYLKTMV